MTHHNDEEKSSEEKVRWVRWVIQPETKAKERSGKKKHHEQFSKLVYEQEPQWGRRWWVYLISAMLSLQSKNSIRIESHRVLKIKNVNALTIHIIQLVNGHEMFCIRQTDCFTTLTRVRRADLKKRFLLRDCALLSHAKKQSERN